MARSFASSFIESLFHCQHWLWFGLEREGLRTFGDGRLADTPHPIGLGAKLTHPHVTTDFGEAQPELITATYADCGDVLDELARLHAWISLQSEHEFFWPSSMPCRLPEVDNEIAIADFGKCNKGQLKYIYRHGLSLRYGRAMQLVSGVHCNFSFDTQVLDRFAQSIGEINNQAWRDKLYFSVMRNYRRYSWVVNYFLGASPVIDQSMAHLSRTIDLTNFRQINDMLIGQGATTLRQSDIGYVSAAQRNANMCFGNVSNWVEGVDQLVSSPYPAFEAIGIEQQGERVQLGHGLLQIENEYYTCIRPKRSSAEGLRPLVALQRHGVEYLEIRNLDCNPFAPCGVDAHTLDFMALFFLWCTAQTFRPLSASDCVAAEYNDRCSATFGRNPATELVTIHLDQALATMPRVYMQEGVDWVCEQLNIFAEQLKKIGKPRYLQALQVVTSRGPLSQLVETHCLQTNYIDSCLSLAKDHRRKYPTLQQSTIAQFQQQATHSQQVFDMLEREHQLHATTSFDDYFNAYLNGACGA